MRMPDNGGVKRTTIGLTEELAVFIKLEARRRRVPVSRLIRDEFTAWADGYVHVPGFIGMFDDDRLTQSEDVEAELELTWAGYIRGDQG